MPTQRTARPGLVCLLASAAFLAWADTATGAETETPTATLPIHTATRTPSPSPTSTRHCVSSPTQHPGPQALVLHSETITQVGSIDLPPISEPGSGCVFTVERARGAVGLDPTGRELYITHKTQMFPDVDALSIIDTTTNAIQASVPLQPADEIAVGPQGDFIYVMTNVTGGTPTLSVIDRSTLGATELPISDSLLASPSTGLALAPDGTRVYVSVSDDFNVNLLVVFDAVQGERIGSFSLGSIRPRSPVVGPKGKEIFVADIAADSIYVLDAEDGAIRDTISVPEPDDLVMSPNGSLYIVSYSPKSVFRIDAATHAVEAYLPLPLHRALYGRASTIALSPSGDRLYVLGNTGTTYGISVIDTERFEVIRTVLTNSRVQDLAVHPTAPLLYVWSPAPAMPFAVPGDADCDGRIGAADVVAIINVFHTGEHSNCAGTNAYWDGYINTRDLEKTIDAVFAPP